MTFTITAATIKAIIAEEVAHAADQAYGEDGSSLYDSVVLTSKDDTTVGRLISDAVAQLGRREADICTFTSSAMEFSVPDIASSMSTVITAEINRYIALHVCTDIFQARRAGLVPDFARRTQEAMDNVDAFLRTRVAPSRS